MEGRRNDNHRQQQEKNKRVFTHGAEKQFLFDTGRPWGKGENQINTFNDQADFNNIEAVS